MGASIFKDYDVIKENAASGGPSMLWKIHICKNKITNLDCSVWSVERKQLDSFSNGDLAFSSLKTDFLNLQRLRYPNIIRVTKPIEEIKATLVSETEPITSSLATILETNSNRFDELEIKLGLIQLIETLHFLHTTAQICHLNICPSSIFICDPDWKLGGFAFSKSLISNDANQDSFYDASPAKSLGSNSHNTNQAHSNDPTKPSLDYLAPELVFLNKIDPKNDMFSLGALIYEIFESNDPEPNKKSFKLLNTSNSVDKYKYSIENMFPLNTSRVPENLRPILEDLLSTDPSNRPTAQELLQKDYFNDTSVKSLQFLVHMKEYDDRSKVEFFKGFKIALVGGIHFSPRLMEQKILPPLLEELKNTILIPLILPIIFSIVEILEKSDSQRNWKSFFETKVFPFITAYTQEPYQIIVILLQKLDFMAKRISSHLLMKVLIPFVCSALDHSKVEVVSLAIKETLPLLPSINHETIRTTLAPKVLNIIHSPKTPQKLRVQSLFLMSKLIPFAARPFVEEHVLPSVLKTLALDRSASTITSVAGVCEVVSLKFGPDFTCTQILPHLLPPLLDPGLNMKQFDTYYNIVNGMLTRIADARRKIIQENEAKTAQEVPSHLSDAEKFQAFSEHLPPVVKPTASVTAKQNQTNTQMSSVDNLLNSSSKQPINQKGAAVFSELLTAQERRKNAANIEKEKNTLVDLNSAAVKAPSPTSSNNSLGSISSDILSLDFKPEIKLVPESSQLGSFEPKPIQESTSNHDFFSSFNQSTTISSPESFENAFKNQFTTVDPPNSFFTSSNTPTKTDFDFDAFNPRASTKTLSPTQSLPTNTHAFDITLPVSQVATSNASLGMPFNPVGDFFSSNDDLPTLISPPPPATLSFESAPSSNQSNNDFFF